ncbi:APC family permease [Pseudomonas sp. TH10]|uniref:APC family permease n=1 Tax=Pseudomonas sp. TH10 TaxID=2796376 RepID=UPI001F5B4A20|nr:APC family permease [Pseudomonas sp. TH10]
MLLLFAVGFAQMSKHLPNAGAYYAYITAGLGRPFGLGFALVAILCYSLALISTYVYAGILYAPLFPNHFGITALPWWQWSLILACIIAALGYFRVDLSAKILSTVLVLEAGIVVVWNCFVVAKGGPEGNSFEWLTFDSFLTGSPGTALLFAVICFAGFEATAVFREETRNPEKTIPRATYASITLLTLFYAATAICIIWAFGPSVIVAQASSDPIATGIAAFEINFGKLGRDLVETLVCSSIFACLLSCHNILARYLYSLSIDGVFPHRLSSIHPRHASPYASSIVISMISITVICVLLVANLDATKGYSSLLGAASYALLILLCVTSISVVMYFRRHRHLSKNKWKTVVAPTISACCLVLTTWTATSNLSSLTGNEALTGYLIGSIIGLVIIGILWAIRLRSVDFDVYRRIGRQKD